MGNNRLFSSLFDALSQGSERFKTIKNINFGVADINDAILSQDNYSIEFLATVNNKQSTVKVLLDREMERCSDLMDSFSRLKDLNLPIFAKSHVYIDELSLINDANIISTVDIIIIEDTKVSFSDFEFDLESNIVSSFASVCIELLSRNITLDLLSFDAFRYEKSRGVYISPVSNFICHTADKNAGVAFKNYLIMQFMYLIIKIIDTQRQEENWENSSIEIENNVRFDLRKIDYFTQEEYLMMIEETLTIIERYSDIDGDALRDAVISDKIQDAIKILSLSSSVHYNDEEVSDYIHNKDFDITGEHCENRLAIRNNKRDKFGYLDFSGELVIDFLYDEVTDFNEDIAICRKGELYGAIDRDGLVIADFKYTALEWDFMRNIFHWEIEQEKGQNTRREFLKR